MKEHFLIKEIYTNRADTEQFDLVMVTAEDSSDIAGLSLNEDGTADGFELITKEIIFFSSMFISRASYKKFFCSTS